MTKQRPVLRAEGAGVTGRLLAPAFVCVMAAIVGFGVGAWGGAFTVLAAAVAVAWLVGAGKAASP